jgi:hypothetical protein
MTGGSDDEVAKTLTNDAWRHHPADAALTATRSYRCGESAADVTAICPGGRTPAVYVTLVATGGSDEPLAAHQVSIQRVVRVR